MKKYIFIALPLIIMASCAKEEFNPKLSNQNKNQIVVEGLITNQPNIQRMVITRATDYMNGIEISGVENAVVTVTCENNSYEFSHFQNGNYTPPADFKAEIGKTYQLSIVIDGITYRAESTVAKPLTLDSISTKTDRYDTDCFEIMGWFNDNKEKDEYFLFKYALNNVMIDTLTRWSTYSDFLTNNERLEESCIFNGLEAKEHDYISVYSLSISEQYFNFIQVALKDIEEPAPFSPSAGAKIEGNISNGALGFFQASAVSHKCAILKK